MDRLFDTLQARLGGHPLGEALARWRAFNFRGHLIAIAGALFALIVGVALLVAMLSRPAVQVSPSDLARLSGLATQGRISGEQAVELSVLLQQRVFAEASAMPTGSRPTMSSEPLEDSARATFADAAAQLLQDPSAAVRTATLEAATPETRHAGLDKLWEIADDESPSSGAIYRYCGALGALMDYPLTQTALERARAFNPQDRRVWLLLGARYARNGNARAAEGATLVGEGLSAAAHGEASVAVGTLERALSFLADAEAKAFVLGQLGDAAAKRDDWAAAERRYRAALELHVRTNDLAGLAIDAPKLARAQAQLGDGDEACATLRAALRAGAETVAGPVEKACPAAPASQGQDRN